MTLTKLLAFLVFIGCSHNSSNKSLKEELMRSKSDVKLTILHTNDHHGHYLKDRKGQIGMAARKTLVDQQRKSIKENNGHSLLLSGGDINTGTMESDLFEAKPDFLGMNQIGYDAMAVGNHEFDNSYETIKKQMKWAGFPFLSANIYWKDSGKNVFDKPLYLVKNFKGIKVGIFGLTTKDTPFKASHEDAKNLFTFKPIVETAKKLVDILKSKEKVDYIIVVTHVGHRGSSTAGGDIDLANKVSGIDVIVGGHSQEVINAEVHNKTIIIQAEDWGKYLGRLDLVLNKTSKKMIDYKLIPVNLKKKVEGKYEFVESEINENKKLLKVFKPFKDKADALGNAVVGSLIGSLDGDRILVRSNPSALGQFVGRAMLDRSKITDVAIINGGALRNSLEAGSISRKKLHKVHPYGNSITTVKMSDTELFQYVEHVLQFGINSKKDIYGGYPHFINMKIIVKGNKLVSISSLSNKWRIFLGEDGDLISNKKEFVFSTLNFTARGGDHYPKISNKESYIDTGFMVNAAMMDYVQKMGVVRASDFQKLSEISLKIID